MADRRALIVAPLYDGKWLPPLPGSSVLRDRLSKCLRTHGKYDVQVADGKVTLESLREKTSVFFESPGELLFYFYGHGCIGIGDLGYFATSEAAPFNEGILMLEIAAMVQKSPALEVVLICDCCHAGKAAATGLTLNGLARSLESLAGRTLLAACGAHQMGWETSNAEHLRIGAFSAHVLEGLEGAAVPRGSTSVRGTSLGEYVTRKFREWRQDPIAQCNETGARMCEITSGFREGGSLQRKKKGGVRILGVPFKPSQLFVGRSAELTRLIETLRSGERSVAVSAAIEGLGGIGKTELVLQLIHDPSLLLVYDIIIWLDGAGPIPPQWEKLALDLSIELPSNRSDNFHLNLEKGLREFGNVLIVLDNATEWMRVSDWIPSSFPLLVTTRSRDFGGSRFVHTELDVLSPESAIELLERMIPDFKGQSGISKVVEEIGGHALALELAGWNMRYLGISPPEYLARLKAHKGDSDFAVAATRYGVRLRGVSKRHGIAFAMKLQRHCGGGHPSLLRRLHTETY